MFMIPFNILFNMGFSQILFFSVITNNTPNGKPITKENIVEKSTIYNVCNKEGIINLAIYITSTFTF